MSIETCAIYCQLSKHGWYWGGITSSEAEELLAEHCATVDVKSNLFEMPVKLARPLNRFAKLDSLQMICRFVIRQTVATDIWHKLPLPPNLISYVTLGSDYIVPS
ncbi:unnamed protein product, partial [Iphiclides podalirius]